MKGGVTPLDLIENLTQATIKYEGIGFATIQIVFMPHTDFH